MRNQFFDPGFLFDFYYDRVPIGTPSALSNASRAGLGKFRAKATKRRFCFFSHVWSPITEKVENLETHFSAIW